MLSVVQFASLSAQWAGLVSLHIFLILSDPSGMHDSVPTGILVVDPVGRTL